MKRDGTESRLIKSRLFVRMFLSYIIMISLLFAMYSVFAMLQQREAYKEDRKREYELKAATVGNAVDFEILSAQHIVSSINSSVTLRNLYSTLVVQGGSINSYMLYESLDELKNIKGSGANSGIYNIVLLFNDYDKAYTASTVIQMDGNYTSEWDGPFVKQGSVNSLFSLGSEGGVIFNTDFVIYGADYAYSGSQREKGTILVLFKKKNFEQMIEKIAENYSGYEIYSGDELVLSRGEMTGNCYEAVSSVDDKFVFKLYVAEDAFWLNMNGTLYVALGIGFLVSIAFIVVAYVLSRRYYSPIGNIEKFISSGEMSDVKLEEERADEFGAIVKGIQNLIGENNGFREKMIHISPYAYPDPF